MTDLISQIHQDHVNMARILKLIESEVDALAAEQPRDLEVLDNAMQYMINFADKIHHAREDILFRRLQQVDPDSRSLVEDIAREHESIYEKGAGFQELVQAVEYGDFILRENIVFAGRDYVQMLYGHMRKEEEELLRQAKEILSKRDLDDISEKSDGDDPVFGEKIQKEYKDLYQHIIHQYGDDWLHPAHRLV